MNPGTRERRPARRSSATTASSSPIRTSRTIAGSATTSSSPTTSCWPAIARSAITRSSAAAPAVHQFVRVGPHAFIGGLSGVENDVIPYGMVLGNRAYLAGLNIIGLRRRGFSREQIHDLRRAYRLLFADEGTLTERVEDVAEEFAEPPDRARDPRLHPRAAATARSARRARPPPSA